MEAGAVPDDQVVDRQQARCRSAGMSQLFFSDQLDEIAAARTVCLTCTQREPCLMGAIARREACGVWGGELFLNGVVLARKRPRGRPRKVDPVQWSA